MNLELDFVIWQEKYFNISGLFKKKVFVYDLDFWVCSHLFTEKAKNLREQYWA